MKFKETEVITQYVTWNQSYFILDSDCNEGQRNRGHGPLCDLI